MTSADTSPPSAGNALVGLAGLGARATVTLAVGGAAAARVAMSPAVAVVRSGLRTPPGQAAHAEAHAMFESLDAVGRRDLARARVELDKALDRAFDRVTTDAVSSQRTSRAIERLLDSEDVWLLVDRIANSPEVLNAIASASVGLTGVVADEARRRTVTADEFAERIARRLLRRSPREPSPELLAPTLSESATPSP